MSDTELSPRVVNWMLPTTPYYTQRNNRNRPLQSCNVTALTQGLVCLNIPIPSPPGVQPEDYLAELSDTPKYVAIRDAQGTWARAYAPREVYAVLTAIANDIARAPVASLHTSIPVEAILRSISLGSVFVASTRLTSYGHVVLVTGFEVREGATVDRFALDDVTKIFVQDPYGNPFDNYRTALGRDLVFTVGQVMDTFTTPRENRKVGILLSNRLRVIS